MDVPRLPNGAQEAEETAVFNLVQERTQADRIKFMSFDTTAINTGACAGAWILLETKIGKDFISTLN